MPNNLGDFLQNQIRTSFRAIQAELGASLREVSQRLEADLRGKALPRGTREEVITARDLLTKLCRKSEWSSKEMASMLVSCSIAGTRPAALPDTIHLGGLRNRLDALGSLTKSYAVEWGQIGFAIANPPAVVFHHTPEKGDQRSVRIDLRRYPPGHSGLDAIPTIMLHSHPTSSHYGLHFSDVDFSSFLVSPTIVVTGLIHRNRALFAIKTNLTKDITNVEACEMDLKDLLKDCERRSATAGGTVRSFTEEVAFYHGLSLYVTQPEEPTIARKVRLRGRE